MFGFSRSKLESRITSKMLQLLPVAERLLNSAIFRDARRWRNIMVLSTESHEHQSRKAVQPRRSCLPAGAGKSLLKEKNVHGGDLEAAAAAGQGALLRNFQAMHEAIMEKAEEGNT